MKNFDLDQIKNRQLQEMPNDFYEKMQQSVLNQTVLKKKSFEIGKKSKFNWYYAVAASLALVFGGTFLFNNDEVVENPHLTRTETDSGKISGHNNPENIKANNSPVLSISEPIEIAELNSRKSEQKIINNSAQEIKITKTENSKKTVKSSNPEAQIDFILANFSAEEMATLAKNSDQDVYLDLYN